MSVHTLRLKWMFQTGTTGEAGNQGLGNYSLEDNQEDMKKSRMRGYMTPVPVKGTGCDEMIIL